MVNKTMGFSGRLFQYSAEPTAATPAPVEDAENEPEYDPLNAHKDKKKGGGTVLPDSALEGSDDDPGMPKVVDRRWYEKNKHIFPASVWEEFDPTKEYTRTQRKDASGNAFF